MTRLSIFIHDVRALLYLAAPMVMGQVGHMLLQVVDVAMIGHLGAEPVAAAGFGSSFMHIFLLFGFGLCMPVHILVAEAHGRADRAVGVLWLVRGLFFTSLYGVVIALVIALNPSFLNYFEQETLVVNLAQGYVYYLAWSLIPSFIYQCFKNFSEAEHTPWMGFVVLCLGFFINVGLNWVFIFGNLGAPQMGVEGAGLATFIARIFMALLLGVWVCWRIRAYLASMCDMFKSVLQRESIVAWVQLGIPGGFQIIFEAGAFILAAFMMGWISADTLAAHHMTVTYAGLIFMIPLGMSFATCIQVAAEVGRNDRVRLRRVALTNLIVASGMMMVFALLTYFSRHWLPLMFFNAEEVDVMAMASTFLIVVALFHVFDGIQVVALGALRGLSDLKIPMLLLLLSFWPGGLLIGYYLGFVKALGGLGIWIGLLCGLGFAALTLTARLQYLLSRSSLRAIK